MADAGEGSTGTLRAGLVVAAITGLGAFGPVLGLSPAWIVVAVGGGLVMLSVDAASWQGETSIAFLVHPTIDEAAMTEIAKATVDIISKATMAQS